MTQFKLDQTMTLSDGRVLGYAQSGDANGMALLLMHGLNSSRLEVCIAEDAMLKAGIRCIGIDRPGIGLCLKRLEKGTNKVVKRWQLTGYSHLENPGDLNSER